MRTLAEEVKAQGFDLKVTHRDDKTGLVLHTDPYIMRVIGEERARVFERPVGSGNLFNKKNEPCGRWVKDEKGKGTWDKKAEHIAFVKPPTADEKLAQSVLEKDSRIAELEKELAAIRGEASKKAKAKPE